LLGVQAVRGRTFTDAEDQPAGNPVVLLSHGFWQRRFGANDAIIGKAITLDNRPYTVVGVLPPAFQLLQPADVMIPFGPFAAKLPDDRSWHPGIIAIARLRPGVAVESARTEMSGIARGLEQQYPTYNTGVGANVAGVQDQLPRFRTILLAIFALSALTLSGFGLYGVIAYSVAERSQEIGIPMALGAHGSDVLRMVLGRGLRLALAGAALGIIGALGATRLLQSFLYGLTPLDLRTYAAVAAILALVAVVASFISARRAVRVDPVIALRNG
jgi:putative ABC transport system permease protein